MARVEGNSALDQQAINLARRIELVEGQGILGDKSFGKSEKQICLVDNSVFRQLRNIDGLCTKKFNANIYTSGIDYTDLEVGDILIVGTAQIEIIQVGKRCFPQCPIIQDKKRCPLPDACAFARVAKSGFVHINDDIFPVE